MHGDAQLSDRLRAYELMELAQSDSHLQARAELDALHADAEQDGRHDVALLAALGQAVHMVVHEDDRSRVGACPRWDAGSCRRCAHMGPS